MQRARANQIAERSLWTRRKYTTTPLNMPICPYVLSEAMGFDLRFVNIPSFEGMYVATNNLILISSERPEGRKRFTCAHEIGHHVLGHGTVIDEILKAGSDKAVELEADLFAGLLLAPKVAVKGAIRRYGIQEKELTPLDAYVLSKYFGVSYSAFIHHIHHTLQLITPNHFQHLSKANTSLSKIREALTGFSTGRQVIKVGAWWQEKAIDIEVGDMIVSDSDLQITGTHILETKKTNCLHLTAKAPGITKLADKNGWCTLVKISKSKYSGMFQFKYEEEVE